MAARLYASGAVPTKKAACEAVGLSPSYLTVMNGNPEVNAILNEVDRAISDKAISLSQLIALMARKAASRVNELIGSQNEHIALKASSDILDRTPETSKTFKATITSWSLDSGDARELAKALVESARVKEQHLAIAAGDFVRVDTDQESTDVAQAKEGEAALRRPADARLEGDREGVEVKAERPDGESSGGLPQAEGNGKGGA